MSETSTTGDPHCYVCGAPVRVTATELPGGFARYVTACVVADAHVRGEVIYRSSGGGSVDLDPAVTIDWRS